MLNLSNLFDNDLPDKIGGDNPPTPPEKPEEFDLSNPQKIINNAHDKDKPNIVLGDKQYNNDELQNLTDDEMMSVYYRARKLRGQGLKDEVILPLLVSSTKKPISLGTFRFIMGDNSFPLKGLKGRGNNKGKRIIKKSEEENKNK